MPGVLRLIVLVLVWPAASCGPKLQPVPEPPSLDSADTTVVQQYDEIRRSVDKPQKAGEQAEAQGQLGMWFQIYRLAEGAEIAYSNALALAPDSPRWAYLRGVLRSQQGRTEEAMADFALVLDAQPGDVPEAGRSAAATRLAELEANLGRLEAAAARLDQLLEVDSAQQNVRGRVGLARVRVQQGDHDAAIRLLEQALKLQPGATNLHYELGTLYRRLGRDAEAEAHLSRSEPTSSTEPLRIPDPWLRQLQDMDVSCLGLLQRARTAMAAGRPSSALDLFRAARRADSQRFAPAFGETRALMALQRIDEAHRSAEALVTAHPQVSNGHVLLGGIRLRLGDPRAKQSFSRALELDADSVTALRNLADLHRADGDLERVEELLARALELAPQSSALAVALSEVQLERGAPDRALETLRLALPVADEPWKLQLRIERLDEAR